MPLRHKLQQYTKPFIHQHTSTLPDKPTILHLYRTLLETGSRFVDYNFRSYTIRKVHDTFKTNKTLDNDKSIIDAYNYGIEQLKLVERQVLINSLYTKGNYVIENVANTHSHKHSQSQPQSTVIHTNNQTLHAEPRTDTTQLDNRTTLENRKPPKNSPNKDIDEPATAVPS